MDLLDRLAAEWPGISGLLVPAAVAIACFRLGQFWNRREIDGTKAEMNAVRAEMNLMRAEGKLYKEESERLAKALTESKKTIPPQRLLIEFGSPAVERAFFEIQQNPNKTVKLYGDISHWRDEEIAKLAAYKRLEDAGLAKIERHTNTTSVSSTSVAAGLWDTYVEEHKDKK